METCLQSDGRHRPTIDDELCAMDSGGAIRSQISDDVGHLEGFGSATDGNAAERLQDKLACVFDRCAVDVLPGGQSLAMLQPPS